MAADCPFCQRIEAGDYGHWPGDDDPAVVWFEPLNPVTRGHMLFVPARHVESALADSYEAAITMEVASRWAFLHREMWGWEACNFITSAGALATQSVYHLHIHLIPRREGDGLALPWTGQKDAADARP